MQNTQNTYYLFSNIIDSISEANNNSCFDPNQSSNLSLYHIHSIVYDGTIYELEGFQEYLKNMQGLYKHAMSFRSIDALISNIEIENPNSGTINSCTLYVQDVIYQKTQYSIPNTLSTYTDASVVLDIEFRDNPVGNAPRTRLRIQARHGMQARFMCLLETCFNLYQNDLNSRLILQKVQHAYCASTSQMYTNLINALVPYNKISVSMYLTQGLNMPLVNPVLDVICAPQYEDNYSYQVVIDKIVDFLIP